MSGTFDFSTDLVLENSRACLHPMALNHYRDLQGFSHKEPGLWDYSLLSAAGDEALKHYIEKAIDMRRESQGYPFVVIDKKTGQVAGSTRFYQINFEHQSLSLGYTWFGNAFQRTGLNRHCKLLLLSYAFEEWQMERVEFRADARNAKSIAAMLAIGCVREGTLRNNCNAPNGRRSSAVFSILKSEWNRGVKKALQAKIH